MPYFLIIAADKGELFLFRITFLPLAALTVYPLVTCQGNLYRLFFNLFLPNKSIPQKSPLFKQNRFRPIVPGDFAQSSAALPSFFSLFSKFLLGIA
ncbi:MAG: hypothetical protein A3H41_00420 [Omnitrophica WOR_2 bacterium RIFCSPLOWO2_02_FULL_45_28]|nr:MAG: hypothetical protein A3H41_00420 [Omnitrophica WOR_2 bacterium RIFCSPLOWO2_02_FULL_45_28]